MTDIDQSSAAARRPHRPSGDHANSSNGEKKLSFWEKMLALMPIRSASLRNDLQEALEAPETDKDSFSPSERTILQNVLKLGDMRMEDVMVPRADIEAVEVDVTVGHVIEKFRQVGHSRMPVYDETLDKVVGMIHIKDVLEKVTEPSRTAETGGGASNGSQSPVRFVTPALKQKISRLELVREVLFVPPSMRVTDLLASMQATHMHMAVVIDEYGGTDGLVTIEDLLEAVVGDIEDEHDEDEGVLIRPLSEDVFVADARVELDDLIEAVGNDFDPGDYAEEVDTLGGLIFALVGRVPVRGEIVTRLEGFDLEVTRADARRVRQVRITRKARREPLMITGPSLDQAALEGPHAGGAENRRAAE